MLIIGHRGAAGIKPENTLESLLAGKKAGADMLEFDVRVTSDDIPILAHNIRLHGRTVSRTTLAELKQAGQVTTLESVLDKFFGHIVLNLEYKPVTGIETVYKLLKKYIKKPNDWDNLIVSSFHVWVLSQLRRKNKNINLALLHTINPFAFLVYQRHLKLTAVGWHRLHVNRLAIEIAKKMNIFSYVYTVNRPQAAAILERRGIDGIVTDYPDKIIKKLSSR